MKTITIRELHDATGKWVRRARTLGGLQVTDHGRVLAKLVPATALPARPYFARRKLLAAFRSAQPFLKGGTDSTRIVSEDRNQIVP